MDSMTRRIARLSAHEKQSLKRRVLALFRRAEMKAVRGANPMGKKTASLHNQRPKSAKSGDLSISYQTLPSTEYSDVCTQACPSPPIIGHKPHGTTVESPSRSMAAKKTPAILPIHNAPGFDDIDAEFPDKYKLELYRLQSKIKNLESDLKDKDGRLLKALAALDDELMFWRTGLNNQVWETMGQILQRVNRLAAAIDHLKDIQPHNWPALELPARWRTDKRP